MNLRHYDLSTILEDTSYQYSTFFEGISGAGIPIVESFQITYYNYKHTTYWSVDRNHFEVAAGYTYSNGDPLSADPSQIVCRIDPNDFTIKYEAGQGAMTIGKSSSVPTTTWYTDHVFSNNKFFHDYSTGDMVLGDGSVDIEGNNENLNLLGSNTGINISNGNITSTSGSVHLSFGNVTLLDGNVTLHSGNVNLSSGNVTLSDGDVALHSGNVNLFGSNQNLNLSAVNTGIRILSGNITSTSGSVHLSSGNVKLTCGDFIALSGDVNLFGSYKNLNLSAINTGIRILSGNITTTSGSVHLSSGNVKLTNGDVILYSGDVNLFGSNQNINLSAVNTGITILSGNITTRTGSVHLSSGNVKLTNGDVILYSGDVNLFGSNQNLNLSAVNTGIRILSGDINVIMGSLNLSAGNIKLNGANKGITISSLSGYVITPTLSTVSLTAVNILNTGTFVEEFVTLAGTTIDCSLGNIFKYNSSVSNQNFTFANVPQNSNSVYKCTLHCYGDVTLDDFPNNVNWSRRSFYGDYISGGSYVRAYADLNGDGNSDTHIITFTTWDKGTTWFADDAKYAP